MTGGRVQHHLRKYLSDDRSGVLIIGYQAQGTLGRKIQEGARQVEIFRDDIKVRASIDTIHSFSAHADRKKIARWLLPSQGPADKIFLVHGDDDTKALFQLYLKDRMESDVFIPKFNEEIEL
jgi:Predicted exonuclease of the beta-lactamase fold involved in RNA processing